MGNPTAGHRAVIGLDLGATTIKAVAVRDTEVIGSLTTGGLDMAAAVREALEGLFAGSSLSRGAAYRAAVTGVRAGALHRTLLPLATVHVDEFRAIGRGGLHLSGLTSAVVASVGTGSAFVAAAGDSVQHLGGTALGGGTLQGLGARVLGTSDADSIVSMAASGSLATVDLTVEDLAGGRVGGLSPDITASNFGKLGVEASRADLALGIISLVLQNVAVMACLAARIAHMKTIVLIGRLALLPQTAGIVGRVADMTGIRFLIPQGAEYATAIGAAVCAAEQALGD